MKSIRSREHGGQWHCGSSVPGARAVDHRPLLRLLAVWGVISLAIYLLGCGALKNPVASHRSVESMSDGGSAVSKPAASALAMVYPLSFASQNDPRWTCDQLGTCSSWTMGSCTGKNPGGCATASVWMQHNSYRCTAGTAADFNRWLTANGGYADGCNILWSRAADWDGPAGLTWVGTNSLTSVAQLKSMIDQGYRLVSSSRRFSAHWVAIRGYTGDGSTIGCFNYYDPWDKTATVRSLGDGWVSIGASLRVFRVT